MNHVNTLIGIKFLIRLIFLKGVVYSVPIPIELSYKHFYMIEYPIESPPLPILHTPDS